VLAVQLVDARRARELDRQVAVLDTGGGQGGERRAAQLLGDADEIDLDQGV
jgi:hypothetical protein